MPDPTPTNRAGPLRRSHALLKLPFIGKRCDGWNQWALSMPTGVAAGPGADASTRPAPGSEAGSLLSRYRTASPRVRQMVARLADRFGRNAEAIDRTDGERGLVLLDKLEMEALLLYEKYPAEFHRLRDVLGADAAADVLLHWREYFGLKRADETDRGILIAECTSL